MFLSRCTILSVEIRNFAVYRTQKQILYLFHHTCMETENLFSHYVYFSGQGDLKVLEVKSNTQAPCEATNKEAFFSRVESYSISFTSSGTVFFNMTQIFDT